VFRASTLLLCAVVLFSCPPKTAFSGGGIQLDVTYELRGGNQGCIEVEAVPHGVPGVSTQASLDGQPRSGTLSFPINQALSDGGLWPQQLDSIIASLYDVSCDGDAGAVVSTTLFGMDALFPDQTIHVLPVSLFEPVMDGGAAGGGAGGGGAGGGGGATGGGATGGGATGGGATGGGATGGGAMGGGAAGGGAAGGGMDTCDGTFVTFPQPFGGGAITDLSVYTPGRVWLVGANPRLALRTPDVQDGGFVSASDCTQQSSYDAVWARSDGRAYVARGNQPFLYTTAGPDAGCSVLTSSLETSGNVTAIGGGDTLVFVANDRGYVTRVPIDGGTPIADQPLAGEVRDLVAFADDDVFVFGTDSTSNHKAAFAHWDGVMWWAYALATASNTELYAASFVDQDHVYAAGAGGSLFQGLGGLRDGGLWTTDVPVPSQCNPVFGLKVTAGGDKYIVCNDNNVYHYDAGWGSVGSHGGTNFTRIRGTSKCDLWAVGNGGLMTTAH
jgi:hypothetical protein